MTSSGAKTAPFLQYHEPGSMPDLSFLGASLLWNGVIATNTVLSRRYPDLGFVLYLPMDL
jgi:hypothetical protein